VAMSPGDAEAKTDADAPCWIWVAKAPDDPKLNATVVPGCNRWKVVSSRPKAAVSDDAADTVIDPVSSGVVADVVVGEPEELLHAAVATRTAARSSAAKMPERRPVVGAGGVTSASPPP